MSEANKPIVEAIKAASVEVTEDGQVLIYLAQKDLEELLRRLKAQQFNRVSERVH